MLALEHQLKSRLQPDWPPPKMTTLSPTSFFSARSSRQGHGLVEAGDGHFSRHGPVATMISSKLPMVLISLISVLNLTSIPLRAISFLYHSMSCLSFSLKDIDEAVMNRPPESVGLFEDDRLMSAALEHQGAFHAAYAAASITATVLGLVVRTILYLLCCIVGGVSAAGQVHPNPTGAAGCSYPCTWPC